VSIAKEQNNQTFFDNGKIAYMNKNGSEVKIISL
jgi:hypothetical protein